MENVTHISPEALSTSIANDFISNHSVSAAEAFGAVARQELDQQKAKLAPLNKRYSDLFNLGMQAAESLMNSDFDGAKKSYATIEQDVPALIEDLKKAGEEYDGTVAITKVFVDAGAMIMAKVIEKPDTLSEDELSALTVSLRKLNSLFDNTSLTSGNIETQQVNLGRLQAGAGEKRQALANVAKFK